MRRRGHPAAGARVASATVSGLALVGIVAAFTAFAPVAPASSAATPTSAAPGLLHRRELTRDAPERGMNQATWWYAVRASGIVAWAVLTAAVAWGSCCRSARSVARGRPGCWTCTGSSERSGSRSSRCTWCRWRSTPSSGFDAVELFVPFASHWEPTATAWGVLALSLMLAVELTSLVRRHLPRRLWHGIHLLSLVAFGMVIAHGLAAGTDADGPPALGAAVGSSLLVAGLLIARVVVATWQRRRPVVPVLVPALLTELGADAGSAPAPPAWTAPGPDDGAVLALTPSGVRGFGDGDDRAP